MADSAAFNRWAASVRAVSREYYDATLEQMFGGEAQRLGQSVKQFYRDWYSYSRGLTPAQALAEIITDIERKLETGTGTLDREEDRRQKIKRGGWPNPKDWSPTGEL